VLRTKPDNLKRLSNEAMTVKGAKYLLGSAPSMALMRPTSRVAARFAREGFWRGIQIVG
jgi:hypothetical protein